MNPGEPEQCTKDSWEGHTYGSPLVNLKLPLTADTTTLTLTAMFLFFIGRQMFISEWLN